MKDYKTFEQIVHESRIEWFDLFMADINNWAVYSEQEQAKKDNLIKAMKSYKRFLVKELKK